jgi:hypothetical protein
MQELPRIIKILLRNAMKINKPICIAPHSSTGGTFLDWSLYYLIGQQTFFHCKSNSYQPVVDNPVQKINAHGHDRNHPSGYERTKAAFETLSDHHSDSNITSFYSYQYQYYWYMKDNNVTHSTDTFREFESEKIVDSDKLHNFLSNSKSATIQLIDNESQEQLVLRALPRQIEVTYFGATSGLTENTADDELFREFYPDSEIHSPTITPWDKRELQALLIRPFDQGSYTPMNFHGPHVLRGDAKKWIMFGDEYIKTIFDFLGLKINHLQYETWLPIYYNWRKLIYKRFAFAWELDNILESIVNGYDVDLTEYELKPKYELIIQHLLLYRYNLCIKGYGIERLPQNTLDIHNLLEPNVYHQLEDIYNCLK